MHYTHKIGGHKKQNPKQALQNLRAILQSATDKIHGMDIVLSDKENIYGLCQFTPNNINPTYYNLEFYEDENVKFICSEKLEGYESEMLESRAIVY